MENFFLPFKHVFWKFSSGRLPLTGSVKFKGKQKTQFLSQSLVSKTVVVLKADKRCHYIRYYHSRFLQTFVVISLRKSTQVKIHTKMAIFWLVFSAKNPVKSDKLALIEGKILNLMFLDINIPVVPTEIGWRVTHNRLWVFWYQRAKSSETYSTIF